MIRTSTAKVKRYQSSVPRAIPGVQPSTSEQKTRLVDLGLDALSRGEWGMVMAIARLIQRGGMAHA